MKQRKEFEKAASKEAKPVSGKTVQELTQQITQIVGKNPKKAAQLVEIWLKDDQKTSKKTA